MIIVMYFWGQLLADSQWYGLDFSVYRQSQEYERLLAKTRFPTENRLRIKVKRGAHTLNPILVNVINVFIFWLSFSFI